MTAPETVRVNQLKQLADELLHATVNLVPVAPMRDRHHAGTGMSPEPAPART